MGERREPLEHGMEVRKSARYYTLGEPGPGKPSVRKVIIALHGYAQHPRHFLRRFAPLAEAGWFVVAPEGLHRLYIEGASGHVGASWMTKEDRENDIADYVRYLDELYERLALEDNAHVVLLGFSQGVATAARWAGLGRCRFDRFLFWAGVFPPDLRLAASDVQGLLEVANGGLEGRPIDVVLGDADPYFDEGLLEESMVRLTALGLVCKQHRFVGAHHIDTTKLLELLEPLN